MACSCPEKLLRKVPIRNPETVQLNDDKEERFSTLKPDLLGTLAEYVHCQSRHNVEMIIVRCCWVCCQMKADSILLVHVW